MVYYTFVSSCFSFLNLSPGFPYRLSPLSSSLSLPLRPKTRAMQDRSEELGFSSMDTVSKNCKACKQTNKPEIMKCTKQEAKTVLTARYRMLECGNNFKGTQSQMCRSCNVLDDEPHRLNHCTRFRGSDYCDSDIKIDFKLAFSKDIHILRDFAPKLMQCQDSCRLSFIYFSVSLPVCRCVRARTRMHA